MAHLFKTIVCFILCAIIAGCFESDELAPVTESHWQGYSQKQATHTVRKGETLYAIAFGYDTDYRSLAQLNHLREPYTVKVGQVLRVRGQHAATKTIYRRPAPYIQKAPVRAMQRHAMRSQTNVITPTYNPNATWQWPVRGRVVMGFAPAQGKKGINIASQKGVKVHAASAGVVAYAGNGIPGYGNLIIIKHNNQYLTAYGNNAKNLVFEGQRVKSGQVIADIGVVERKYWGVHFEIRKMGTPVNPMGYLH
jgi:lipoprotein NlpD